MFHGGAYYWYGENKENTKPNAGVWHNGVRCYSSTDLYNWKSEGIILRAEEAGPLHPLRIMDRPHILYNLRDDRFVMYIKFAGTDEQPGNWEVQYMGVAVSDKITGPFSLTGTFHPLGMHAGDFDLYKDPRDEKAYLVFGRIHTEIVIADLTADYTGLTGHYSSCFKRSGPPFGREAPAVFKRGGEFFMLTSGTSGYLPNPTEAGSARFIHGPWAEHGDACPGDDGMDSFNAQFSSVFKVPGRDLFIALGDRWLGDYRNNKNAPDMSEAGYVWLPVVIEGGRPVIRWLDEWEVEGFPAEKPEVSLLSLIKPGEGYKELIHTIEMEGYL